MSELYRYAAFISYSSKDAKFAQRLHRALESYGIPSSLGKFDLIGGGKQNRIYPVFRDREELSAGHLGDQIEANLKASAALIVVCSPNGAASPWVQKEIEFFAAQGRHAKIFAIIPDTAPLVDDGGADCTQTCFPPAFRGDALSGDKLEPLAADARKGKDGFRNAWLKIVAGLVGVTPGQIIDRDKRARRDRVLRAVAVSTLVLLGWASESWWQPIVYRFFNPEYCYYEAAFSGDNWGLEGSEFDATFNGSEVKFHDVVVGEVTNLHLDRNDPATVIVRFRVDQHIAIHENGSVHLAASGDRFFLSIETGTPDNPIVPGVRSSRETAPRLSTEINPSATRLRERRAAIVD